VLINLILGPLHAAPVLAAFQTLSLSAAYGTAVTQAVSALLELNAQF